MAKVKLALKKYAGDDMYSWAVFRAADVKGMRSPIMPGQARPLIAGLAKMEAEGRKRRLEASME